MNFIIAATLCAQSPAAGILEGNLKITSLKTVELAKGEQLAVTAQTYTEYPLVIFKSDGKSEVTEVTTDSSGHYRVSLPPGNYILDVKDRPHTHARAEPQPFTIRANETVHLDMALDTGIR